MVGRFRLWQWQHRITFKWKGRDTIKIKNEEYKTYLSRVHKNATVLIIGPRVLREVVAKRISWRSLEGCISRYAVRCSYYVATTALPLVIATLSSKLFLLRYSLFLAILAAAVFVALVVLLFVRYSSCYIALLSLLLCSSSTLFVRLFILIKESLNENESTNHSWYFSNSWEGPTKEFVVLRIRVHKLLRSHPLSTGGSQHFKLSDPSRASRWRQPGLHTTRFRECRLHPEENSSQNRLIWTLGFLQQKALHEITLSGVLTPSWNREILEC